MGKFTGMEKRKIFIEDAQTLPCWVFPGMSCACHAFQSFFSISLPLCGFQWRSFHPLIAGGMLWAGSACEPALQAGRICVCRGLLQCSKTVAGAWHKVKHYEESEQIGLGGVVRRHKCTNTSCQAHHICSETLLIRVTPHVQVWPELHHSGESHHHVTLRHFPAPHHLQRLSSALLQHTAPVACRDLKQL